VPHSLARRLALHLTAAFAVMGSDTAVAGAGGMQAVSRRGVTPLRTRIALLGEAVK
jgi:hypothetical protein